MSTTTLTTTTLTTTALTATTLTTTALTTTALTATTWSSSALVAYRAHQFFTSYCAVAVDISLFQHLL